MSSELPYQRLLRLAILNQHSKSQGFGSPFVPSTLLGGLNQTTTIPNPFLKALLTKRKVFVSFHHKNDRGWFDLFTRYFSEKYEIFSDKSIGEEKVRSDDPEYINRAIREDYIKGSSITIVLCGPETHKRKYVDWEIYSTLHHEHALLGIVLPTVSQTYDGKSIVPERLFQNINSGYAHYINWTNDPAVLKANMETAINKSAQKFFKSNSQEKMKRNLS